MKKFIEEFKAFALRGNVMDMAIGVIIGGAFTSIVTSLTENIINPILGLFGGTDLRSSHERRFDVQRDFGYDRSSDVRQHGLCVLHHT